MVLEVTLEELEILRELVAQAVDELGPEIHHTFSRDYRAALQKRRDRLTALQERLAAQPAGAQA